MKKNRKMNIFSLICCMLYGFIGAFGNISAPKALKIAMEISGRKDTAIFKGTTTDNHRILSFNSKNEINLPSSGLRLTMKETIGDSYTLTIKRANRIIFSRKGVKGISKVLKDKEHLLFSLFKYTDEDGNNEGIAFVVDLKTNSVKKFPSELKNTCNPIYIDSNFYLVDGLTLLRISSDLKLTSQIKIFYRNKRNLKDFSYLDSYMICSLSKGSADSLVIGFTANKNKECRGYSGIVNNDSKVVLLD